MSNFPLLTNMIRRKYPRFHFLKSSFHIFPILYMICFHAKVDLYFALSIYYRATSLQPKSLQYYFFFQFHGTLRSTIDSTIDTSVCLEFWTFLSEGRWSFSFVWRASRIFHNSDQTLKNIILNVHYITKGYITEPNRH